MDNWEAKAISPAPESYLVPPYSPAGRSGSGGQQDGGKGARIIGPNSHLSTLLSLESQRGAQGHLA